MTLNIGCERFFHNITLILRITVLHMSHVTHVFVYEQINKKIKTYIELKKLHTSVICKLHCEIEI